MGEKKQLTIKEFVEKYNALNSAIAKENLIKGIVKRKYCPIMEKKMVLQMALDKSVLSREDGVEFIDMFVSKINMTMFTVSLYTNLLTDKKEDGSPDITSSYDLLYESEILDKILLEIGDREMQELSDVYQTIIDSWYNAHSVQNLIVTQLHKIIDKFTSGTNKELQNLESVLKDENRIKSIFEAVNKIKK